MPRPELLEGTEIAVRGEYVFAATVSYERFYHSCEQFKAADAGSGNASLSWTIPPDRFDRDKVILRRAAGSTPPASATAGTGVTLSGDLATSVTDNPGSGSFAYSLFGAYDESGTARYSASRTQTVTVT